MTTHASFEQLLRDLTDAFLKAQEQMIVEFCAKVGLELPPKPWDDAGLRLALKDSLLIVSQNFAVREVAGGMYSRSFCVDIRNGRPQSFELTYPYVRCMSQGIKFWVELVYNDSDRSEDEPTP